MVDSPEETTLISTGKLGTRTDYSVEEIIFLVTGDKGACRENWDGGKGVEFEKTSDACWKAKRRLHAPRWC